MLPNMTNGFFLAGVHPNDVTGVDYDVSSLSMVHQLSLMNIKSFPVGRKCVVTAQHWGHGLHLV